MRIFGLLLLVFIASCGKDSSSSKSSFARQEEEASGQKCLLNHKWVKCSSLADADGQGVDILDTLIDIPAQVANGVITFSQSAVSTDKGRRISCTTKVEAGDSYRYDLRGDTLILDTNGAKFEYKRFSGGPGVKGSWMWKGYLDRGTLNVKTLTIIGSSRVILRDHCEL